jgi:hypothetical protein
MEFWGKIILRLSSFSVGALRSNSRQGQHLDVELDRVALGVVAADHLDQLTAAEHGGALLDSQLRPKNGQQIQRTCTPEAQAAKNTEMESTLVIRPWSRQVS